MASAGWGSASRRRAASAGPSARQQPRVEHELRSGDERARAEASHTTASATSSGSIHGTGSRLPAERSAISRGVMPSIAASPSFIGVLTPVGWIDTTRTPCGASSIAHDLVSPTSAPLAGGVVAQPVHAAQAGDRGVVDDDARLPADHVRDHATRDNPRALQVDVEHRVPLRLGQLVGEAVGADAGVVEQHVDAAELLGRRSHGGRDRRVVAHVGGERRGGDAERFDLALRARRSSPVPMP